MSPCPYSLAIVALLLSRPAWATEAPDPTRPPGSQMPAPALAAPPVGGERAGAAGDAAAPALELQSLQLPRSGDATAIISGRLYRVGDRIGAETITRIDAHGVVLKGPNATRGLTPYGVLALNIDAAPRARAALAQRPPALPSVSGASVPEASAPEAPKQVRLPIRPAPAPAARVRSVALVVQGGLTLRLDLGPDNPAAPLRSAAPARVQASLVLRPPTQAPSGEGSTPRRPAPLSAALASVADSPQAGVIPVRFPSGPPMAGYVPR